MSTFCPIAIVLCRNGLQLTKRAVESIEQQTLTPDLLLIDNASEDGTAQWIAARGLTAISLSEVVSVSKAWNLALQWAWRAGYGAAWVNNNDVEFRPDTLEWLVRDGGGFVTPVSVGSKEQLTDTPPTTTRPHPDFSSFLIRKRVYELIGEFDEQFNGAYGEDCDYHLRMHKAGVNAVSIDLPYYHVGSGTARNSTGLYKQRINRQADRNRRHFETKYGFKLGSPEYYVAFGTDAPEESRL